MPRPIHYVAAFLLAIAVAVGSAFQPIQTLISADKRNLNRREFLASTLAVLTAVPPTVHAGTTLAAYQGVYSDPNHPKGYRIVVGDDKEATLKLQDDPKAQEYELPVQVATDKKTEQVQLTFDLSPKGGPKDLVAVLGDNGNSILFPDGNTWTKQTNGIVGVYQDSLGPNAFVSIRPWKGAELRVELMQGSKTTAAFGAKAGSQKAFFEYPGEFNKAGFINAQDHTITFRDGTVWTRF